MSSTARPAVDLPTIVGWGMLLMPLLTMWHEIGGHAAACALLGGPVETIGAFYVQCRASGETAQIIVALAGVTVNALLALVAHALWARSRSDSVRLPLWLVWVSEAFVATGYFCFSGATGFGDLGTGSGGALAMLPHPLLIRAAEFAIGVLAYIVLARLAIRTLHTMLGTGSATRTARRRVAHGYYATCGIAAVLVGLLNPVGVLITIMSAAASSFGGLAGFISIGFADGAPNTANPFTLPRSWPVIALGAIALSGFAFVLGPR